MDTRVFYALFVGVLTVVIGFIPLFHRRDRLANLFALFNLFLGLWCMSDISVALPISNPLRLFLYRSAYCAGVITMVFFFSFMFEFLSIPLSRFQKIWRSFLFSGFILGCLTFTSLLVSDIDFSQTPYREIPGKAMPTFIAYLLFGIGFPLFKMVQVFRQSTGVLRTQIGYVFLAISFVFVEILAYVITLYFKNLPPYYYLLQVAYTLTMAYAIVRHRLMDIGTMIRSSVIYLLFALIFTVPIGIFLSFSSSHGTAVFWVFLTLFIAPLVEKKVVNALGWLVDKLPPFQGRYQYLEDIPGFHRVVSESPSVKNWARNLAESLNRRFELENVAVFVFDEPNNVFLPVAGLHLDLTRLMFSSPKPTDPLIERLRSSQRVLPNKRARAGVPSADPNEVGASMDLFKATLCVPIFNGQVLLGFVSLGHKISRDAASFKAAHFNLPAIQNLLEFAPTASPDFLYVHALVRRETGLQEGGDPSTISSKLIAEAFNRLAHRPGWVGKTPGLERLSLRAQGLALLEKFKNSASPLSPNEESLLNTAVLEHYYRSELAPFRVIEEFDEEDLAAIENLVRGAESSLLGILFSLATRMRAEEWAHDLQQPFSSGSFRSLDGLLAGEHGPLNPEQHTLLSHIREDALFVERRIAGLTNPEMFGGVKLKTFDAVQFLQAAAKRFSYSAKMTGVGFHLELPPDNTWVRSDPDLLMYRALNNIFKKALQLTPKGGTVALGLRTEKHRALIYVKCLGGPTIPEHALAALLSRGNISKHPDPDRKEFEGYDLYNAQSTLRECGSELRVISTPAEGTVFSFPLPAAGVILNPSDRQATTSPPTPGNPDGPAPV